MTLPISVKKPDKLILVYGGTEVELECKGTQFEHFIFYSDQETMDRLEAKGIIVSPPAQTCGDGVCGD